MLRLIDNVRSITNKIHIPKAAGLVVIVGLLICAVGCARLDEDKAHVRITLPPDLLPFIVLSCDKLGGRAPEAEVERIGAGLFRIRLTFDLESPEVQDDWQCRLRLSFTPDFHWSPHLTPESQHIVDQHAFRSPALIATSRDRMLALVPDLDIMTAGTPVRWYLDLDAPANLLALGMSNSQVVPGLFFVREPGAAYPAGSTVAGFYLFVSTESADIANPWRKPLAFMWNQWGAPLFESGQPLAADLEAYVRHTYDWAFRRWKDSVWQEFDWQGRRVGAPVFIVNQTQSPNYPGEVNEREFRSIWNQAWFCSLRSASGLFRYARRTGDQELLKKARLTKELALASPMREGIFDTVIATEMEKVQIDGGEYNRSRGWGTAFWGNSDRNPVNRPADGPRNRKIEIAPYHVLDMSMTALWMLHWYEELEQDSRLLEFAGRYAERLLQLQHEDGFFPVWLSRTAFEPLGILERSPETSLSATFLFKLAELKGHRDYQSAALRAIDAVAREVVPTGRWEDFETYWSSSRYGNDWLIGRKVVRNNMHKQCNFSIFWTAEALYEAYHATGERRWLDQGQRVLDELLMTQASWQPPYMYVPVLGGFGVMNADGEWLDARQSLFAELIIRYGLEMGVEEYVQRGLAAMRASFVMMYCPENPVVKALWEKVHSFFGPEDYGFTMENYAHGGRTSPEGAGMGIFTIYDWGNGAAAETWNRLLDRFGREFLLRTK